MEIQKVYFNCQNEYWIFYIIPDRKFTKMNRMKALIEELEKDNVKKDVEFDFIPDVGDTAHYAIKLSEKIPKFVTKASEQIVDDIVDCLIGQ